MFDTLTAEEETAVVAAERGVATVYDPNTKNGFPIALNPETNAKFEELLQAKVLQVVRAFHGLKTMQVLHPSTNGTIKNVVQNKKLIKAVVPAFRWKHSAWIREAPPGW